MYWFFKFLTWPLVHASYRIHVEGRHNIPRRGPVILAANHRSFFDSVFLPNVVRRRVTFVAKAEYFDNWKLSWFFSSTGQIPIRRGGGHTSEEALDASLYILNRGGVFAIYPEGTRTRDGKLHRGKTGVARLALRSGAPIIPVGIIGTDEVMPVSARFPKLFQHITIRFGEPIVPDVSTHERPHLRELTDQVMKEIQTLTNYEYDGHFTE